MYCANCGAESTFGLNYCKHCGGNLAEGTAQQPATPARNIFAALILAAATTGIVLGGLAIVFSFARDLIGPQPEGYGAPVHDAIAVAGMMVVFGSAAIILATFLLMKLFGRLMGFGVPVERPSGRPKAPAVGQRVAQISAPAASMHSVTEHTTRNFEPRVYQRDTSE